MKSDFPATPGMIRALGHECPLNTHPFTHGSRGLEADSPLLEGNFSQYNVLQHLKCLIIYKIMCLTFLTVQVYLENNFIKLLSYIKFTSIFNHWDLILFFLFLRFNSWGSKTVHWSLRISEVKRRVCLFKKKNKSHSWKWSQSKYHYSAKY